MAAGQPARVVFASCFGSSDVTWVEEQRDARALPPAEAAQPWPGAGPLGSAKRSDYLPVVAWPMVSVRCRALFAILLVGPVEATRGP